MRRWLTIGLAVFGFTVAGLWLVPSFLWTVAPPIRVGILHSRTGPLAISEQPMIEAEILALEELNEAGGLLGRRLEWIVADGRSDPQVFAQEARRLIESEKVAVLFGCWSSSSRRSVKSVVESTDHLLVFASNYEGADESPSIVHTGPLPNQQVIPAVNWCYQDLGARKFFLAGSTDIQSSFTHELIQDLLKTLDAQCVGTGLIALDGTGVEGLVEAIRRANPDVVLSTIAGSGNKAFYSRLSESALRPEQLPVVSFTVSEVELANLPVAEMVGDYAAWCYFQSLEGQANRAFVERFQARYGGDRTTSDSIAAAYNGVLLWAQAVEEAQTAETAEVRKAISWQSRNGPEGVISIDAETLHTWRPFYVGRIRADGQFEITWSLEKPVRPLPYPSSRPRAAWAALHEKFAAAANSSQLMHDLADRPNRVALPFPVAGAPPAPGALVSSPVRPQTDDWR